MIRLTDPNAADYGLATSLGRHTMKSFGSRKGRHAAHHHKHLTYFKLEKALGEPGCALCTLIRASVEQFFDAFLYEKVNDVGLRARFNRDGGMCARHAYRLLGYHDGLAIATIYRPLLERAVAAVSARLEPPENEGGCFVCDVERESEERYASVAADFLGDTEFERTFKGSDALCLPHYRKVSDHVSPLPEWFVQQHAAKFGRLLEGVKRYLDAANWSLGEKRPKLSEEEERIARDVIATYYGRGRFD